jgi:polysaccharide transporter, PST family
MKAKLAEITNRLSPNFKKILGNTAWLVGDKVLRMGASLVVGVWVARYLGVQQYGLFNYAYAFASLFSPVATLGLDSIVIRELVRVPEERYKTLGTTFWLKLFGGFCSIILAVCTIFFVREDDSLTIGLVAIFASTGFFQAFDTIDLWFQSQVQSKYTVIAKNIAFAVTTVCKVILIQAQAPLIAFVCVNLLEYVLSGISLIITYSRNDSFHKWFPSILQAKKLLKDSYPLILSSFAVLIYMRIDQIMLGQMVGSNAVGTYSAAVRVSEIWYFIPTAIASSVSPSIFAVKDDKKIYYQRIAKLLRLMVLLAIAVALPMTFLSGHIITVLFGSSYIEAGIILAIHIWASLFVFMGVATSSWFVAEGLTHLSFRRTLIGAVVNVLLNLILIPKFSGLGAAIATVISYSISDVFSNFTHAKTRKIFQLQIKSLIPIL